VDSQTVSSTFPAASPVFFAHDANTAVANARVSSITVAMKYRFVFMFFSPYVYIDGGG
jgi:hypothetical protein